MASPARLRSLYRRLLRELPHRQPSSLANPSPLQKTIRAQFSSSASSAEAAAASTDVETDVEQHRKAMDQFVQYLKAQRVYTALLERYNPGMNMSEEDRVRLTARRVGMDLPPEFQTKS